MKKEYFLLKNYKKFNIIKLKFTVSVIGDIYCIKYLIFFIIMVFFWKDRGRGRKSFLVDFKFEF